MAAHSSQRCQSLHVTDLFKCPAAAEVWKSNTTSGSFWSNKTAAGRLVLWGERHWRQTESLFTDRRILKGPSGASVKLCPVYLSSHAALYELQSRRESRSMSGSNELQFVILQVLQVVEWDFVSGRESFMSVSYFLLGFIHWQTPFCCDHQFLSV